VCVCSLRYAACNEHAPYCHLWSDPALHFFFHFVSQTPQFSKKKLFDIKRGCFDFLYNFCRKYSFFILRRTERDIIINVRRYSCKVPRCSMRVGGRTEGRTDMTKLTLAFRNLSHEELPQYSRALPRHFSFIILRAKPSVDSIYRSAAIW